MKVSGSKMALAQVVLGFKHRNAKKNIQKSCIQNYLPQMLEIWRLSLPGSHLSSLFK